MKKTLLLVLVLLLVAAACQSANAQTKDQSITLSPPVGAGSALTWVPPGPYKFNLNETLYVVNKSGHSPVAISIRDSADTMIAAQLVLAQASASFVLDDTAARYVAYSYLDTVISSTIPPETTYVVVNDHQSIRGASQTPTLTQWGLISLLALILLSGVIVAIRKRTAVA